MSSSDEAPVRLDHVKPERARRHSHPIHPYFGKVDPALARALIEQLSDDSATVLDPFCGSGTVLLEAHLSGRSAVGWDSSPLACMIATAKLVGLGEPEEHQLARIQEDVRAYSGEGPLFTKPLPRQRDVPDIGRVVNVAKWFTSNAIQELAFIRNYLRGASFLQPVARLLADTAFSRSVTAASNQQGESSYRCVQKPDDPGRVLRIFLRNLDAVAKSAKAADNERDAVGIHAKRRFWRSTSNSTLRWGELSARVLKVDARRASSSSASADLVVSSPPYLMSWDYGLYHKFRFYWLGYDLDSYEETEIGRHLRRKKDDVERYSADMSRAFLCLDKCLNPAATIALINAPSVVYGEQVDTNELLGECASHAGWSLVDKITSLDIPGPHHGMYASLESRKASAPGRRGKKEHVLIFRRSK